ncbi:RasGEF domain-containing protein [Legionella fallonii]|uniref:Ras-GEF domain-containing protein n=1 Tax=Legionella fallonii LLAP-10 TaxID=1212491 RepID=A0A098G5Y6_9GAMM|nr:RasGEF domain-containing protein [Legionella fallonii]CEG56915.1 protein of unknown function [ank domain][Ras domain][coiled-coil domain] [Legionella fallonii LLAP-10]
MTIETIRALITSDQDEQKIEKKIVKILKANPSLASRADFFDRSIFHLLFLHKKYNVIDALLKARHWQDSALLGDHHGNTLLHYIVNRGTEEELHLINIILEQLPEIINRVNESGNTALHEAIIGQKLWAAKCLVRCAHIDRMIKNKNEQTVMDLAEDKSEFKQILLYINLSSLDLRSRFTRPGSKDNLRENFPVLTSRSHSDSSSSPKTSELLHSPLKFSESSLSELDSSDESEKIESPKEKQKEIMSDDEAERSNRFRLRGILKKLADKLKDDRKSPYCHELKELFVDECHRICLLDEALECTPEIAEIIEMTLNHLDRSVQERYTKIQNSNYNILSMFVFMLINNNLTVDAEPRSKPIIHEDYKYQAKALKTVWLLTACQSSFDAKREFDFAIIAQRALGVLPSYSYLEILVCIRRLYPDFDRAQKLVANFIVLQLLIYHVNDKVNPFPTLKMQLRFICQLNVDEHHGLGKLGEQINAYLNKATQLNMALSREPLLRNFHFLNRQINQPTFVRMNQSFDELVNNALSKTKKKRVHEVSLIASELRMLTIYLYQRVSIAEFADSNWLKTNKQTLSPHISLFTEALNKLSTYFTEKILTQPEDNIQNALQFLSEIAEAICPLDGENYPDLNSSMLLSSVFNKTPISRLKPIFEALDPIGQKVIKELDTVTSQEKHALFMREVYHNRKTALPFCGEFLTNMTFAHDGNAKTLFRAESFGCVLKKLMEVKLLINFTKVHFHTDLSIFITEYQDPGEEYLDCLSYRHQPSKAHVINLDTAASFDSLLDELKINYLSKNILPSVMLNGELHPPQQLAAKLIFFYTKQLNSPRSELLTQSFDKLQETIHEIIKINNEYYYPKKLADKLKASLFSSQLTKMEKRVKNDEEQEEEKILESKQENEKKPARKGTLRRRSLHFLESLNIIQPARKTSEPPSGDNEEQNIRVSNI